MNDDNVTHVRFNGKGHPAYQKFPYLPAYENKQGNELWVELEGLAALMPGTSAHILKAAGLVARDHGIRAALGFVAGLGVARAVGDAAGMHIDLAISDILDLVEAVGPEDAEGPSE